MTRYTHYTTDHPSFSADRAQSGQGQAETSLPRYHYLRAAVTGAYDIQHDNPNASLATLNFSRYDHYALEPLHNLKLHPDADGYAHPEDLEIYKEELFGNWKVREAGILYAVHVQKQFWNMVLGYNSPARSTGVHAWDALFNEWKDAGFPKGMIPCMWFARACGCMDPGCQFKHDTEATQRDKALIYAWRRAQIGKLTSEDEEALRDVDPVAASPVDDGLIVRKIQSQIEHPEPEICWNRPTCAQSLRGNAKPAGSMQRCKRCKAVTYCSGDCQKQHWRTHKTDCHPYDEIIHNDDLWSTMGSRKGLQKSGAIIHEENGRVGASFPPGYGQ